MFLFLAFGLVFATAVPVARRDAWAGPITVSPALDVEVRDEQPPSEGVPEGAWIARVTPQLALAYVGTTSLLEMRGLRGFDAQPTWSAHWLADPRLHEAVARHLERERAEAGDAIDWIRERSALKAGTRTGD